MDCVEAIEEEEGQKIKRKLLKDTKILVTMIEIEISFEGRNKL